MHFAKIQAGVERASTRVCRSEAFSFVHAVGNGAAAVTSERQWRRRQRHKRPKVRASERQAREMARYGLSFAAGHIGLGGVGTRPPVSAPGCQHTATDRRGGGSSHTSTGTDLAPPTRTQSPQTFNMDRLLLPSRKSSFKCNISFQKINDLFDTFYKEDLHILFIICLKNQFCNISLYFMSYIHKKKHAFSLCQQI